MILLSIADHNTMTITVNLNSMKLSRNKLTEYEYKKMDGNKLQTELRNRNWNWIHQSTSNVDKNIEELITTIQHCQQQATTTLKGRKKKYKATLGDDNIRKIGTRKSCSLL